MAKKTTRQEAASKTDPNEITHGTLIDWINDADIWTTDSREMSEKCRNYYDSRQISDIEDRMMRKRKQAPVVINRIKPKIDGLAGMERSNRTTAKAYPRTPKHEGASESATEAVRFVLQDNFYNQVRSSAWDNLTIEGTCGVEIDVQDRGEGKSLKICINHLMWDRLVYDPHARRKDLKDTRFKGQVIWLDYDLALERFPDGQDVLESMIEGSDTYQDKPRWMDHKRRRVKIVELYYRQKNEMYYACFTRGGYLKGPKVSPYKNEEGETEDPYEFASLFVDREGNRYGAVLQYLDVQDEINKRRSKALHLMSVRQVRWERGAVEDINKTREELAKPDGVVETTPGMEFEILKTGDMAAAQFNLLAEAKQEIDAVGFSAAASGKETRNMSGVALRNREVASQTELAPMFDVLKHLDIRVYRKVWNRIKQYWREEMWLRVTDDEQSLRWVGLNKPITKGAQILQQAQSQGMPPPQLQQLQQQIAQDPSMKEVVDTQNDIATLDVDIVMDDAPDSVTMQQEEFTALSEMVKAGIPIPPTAIVSASNLKDKDKILKEMKSQGQVPPQVQEQMKKMQEEGQKLQQENQQLKAGMQSDMAKIQAHQAESQAKIGFQQQEAAATMEVQQRTHLSEMALERERHTAELAMQREKEQATRELEAMKEDAAQETELRKAALQGAVSIEVARINATKDAAEGTTPTAGAQTGDIMKQIMDTHARLLEHISKPKTVTAKSSTGTTMTATVQ